MTSSSYFKPSGNAIASASGTELVTVDNGGPLPTTLTTLQIAALAASASSQTQISALSTTGAGTLLASQLAGKIITLSGASAAATFTTDTAAAIISAMPTGAATGTTYTVEIANMNPYAMTIAGGSGVTVSGAAIVSAMTWSQFLLRKASATTVTLTYVTNGPVRQLAPQQLTTTDGSATIAVGSLTAAQINNLTLTGTVAPATVTLPPASEIIAAFPNGAAGMHVMVNIANVRTTTGVITFAGGLSTQISGLATLTGQNTYASFDLAIDANGTGVTLTRIG